MEVEEGVDKMLPGSGDPVLLHPSGPSSAGRKDKLRPQESFASKIVGWGSRLRGLCWTPRRKVLHLGSTELFLMGELAWVALRGLVSRWGEVGLFTPLLTSGRQ